VLSLKELWEQNHRINSKTVEGNGVIYYRDNTDTACSVSIGDIDYHFFDGTNTGLEWIKNFLAFRTGDYHSAIGYDKCSKDLFKKMRDNMSIARRNVFVGYSRGGAIAMLTLIRHSMMCYRRGIKPRDELITFEMPKAGGRRLKKHCAKLGFEHTRVIMVGDVVPNIVWWWSKQYTTRLITLKNKEKGI